MSMHVQVDKTLCSGHALCWGEAPAVYLLDNDGYNALAGAGPVAVPGESEDAARVGAEACPEHAIRLITANE
jgi:ferredoxin